ncbi:histidine kinase [Salinimicrobium sp. 3283s]|uniref:histidine kinase n=1 Tax=Salinimicrobium sp. 3283s TaxID=3114359 RepID=UPI0031EBB519
MMSTNLLQGFRKHRKFFYLSVLVIAGFFATSALITPNITLVAEKLLEEILRENLETKKNIVAFEFNRLDSFLEYSEKVINDSTDLPFERIKENLLFITELARSTEVISNSFIYAVTLGEIQKIHRSETLKEPDLKDFSKHLNSFEDNTFFDTIISTPQRVINRKFYFKKIDQDTAIVVGYDIDLLNFWKYFSEKYKGDSGYTVVTNQEGVCLLHPEPEFIGKRLDGFFGAVSIDDVLSSKDPSFRKSIESASGDVLKDTATSEFLGLEVVRYFDQINIGKSALIIVESFPVEINLKETTQNIQEYFSWISLVAFLTFILLLMISRIQLKEEYVDNLKVLEEKERLVNTNEKYQKENAVLQLNQLKKKMNPHFLFNSLNSLHVLIESKPELSQEFVLKLAEVYRYLLENREGNLTTVKKELYFLKQYVFLQEIRFKNSLKVEIINKGDELVFFRKIPFLSLETMVENAIKHNEFTKSNPLIIEIIIHQEVIEVLNNYTPRKFNDKDSHKLGLTYLKNIYLHHQESRFKTEIIDGKFKCILPLLS